MSQSVSSEVLYIYIKFLMSEVMGFLWLMDTPNFPEHRHNCTFGFCSDNTLCITHVSVFPWAIKARLD